MEELFVYDIRWKDTMPYIVFSKENNINTVKLELLTNKIFCHEISKERFCPGYINLWTSTRIPCRERQLLPIKEMDRCFQCESKFGFKKGFLFHNYVNKDVELYFSQPHFLYLAVHNSGVIKVGTASELRKHDRLYEQGALMYIYLAQSDLKTIQYLEGFLANTLSLKLRHPTQAKIYAYSEAELVEYKESLKQIAATARDILVRAGYEKILVDSEVLVITKSKDSYLGLAYYSTAHFIEFPSFIIGEVVHVVGDLITLKERDEYYVIKKQSLIGRKLIPVKREAIPEYFLKHCKQLELGI